MKQALFARTANLRDIVTQLRAHETPAVEVLESEILERLRYILGPLDAASTERARALVRDFVAGLARGPEAGTDLDTLWDAIAALEAAGESGTGRAAAAGPGTREIERWLKRSLGDLRRRDPAAHLRLRNLLHGIFPTRSAATPESEGPRGARGVLARTEAAESAMSGVPPVTREEARDLLRWRDILASLLPEGCRPTRRVIVPGGVPCADADAPRLAWLAISGCARPEEEGAFQAHLFSCDHCFEFHYRIRHAARVLRERKASLFDRPRDGAHHGFVARIATRVRNQNQLVRGT